MKQQLSISAALILSITATAQPICKIVSFDHFGGNATDVIYDEVITYEDGSFSFMMSTNSTISTTIRTDCPDWGLIRRYNASYSELLSQDCAPTGGDFEGSTFFFYPQPDGDTIFIGGTGADIAIERRASDGTVRWNKVYGGAAIEAPDRVELAADGTFLVLSKTTSSDGDVGLHYGTSLEWDLENDMWLVKLDTAGNLVWGKVLGGTGLDFLSTIIPSEDGGCYLFGATSSSDHDATGLHGNTDVWIVKLDGDGNKEWHKMFGGSDIDGCRNDFTNINHISTWDNRVYAIRDSGSGFYVLARTRSHDGDVQHRIPADEKEDLWLLHIDSAANILWENTFGGPDRQIATGLCRGADGSIWMAAKLEWSGNIVGGDINVSYNGPNGWVVHADSLGNLLNQRVIGARGEEWITVLYPLNDGTVLAGGHYYYESVPLAPHTPGFPDTGEGAHEIFVARLSPESDLSIENPGIKDNAWGIAPIPAHSEVTVRVTDPIGAYEIGIYNSEGKKVFSKKGSAPSMTLSTAELSDGMYMVTLKNRTGNTGSKKLIIQH